MNLSERTTFCRPKSSVILGRIWKTTNRTRTEARPLPKSIPWSGETEGMGQKGEIGSPRGKSFFRMPPCREDDPIFDCRPPRAPLIHYPKPAPSPGGQAPSLSSSSSSSPVLQPFQVRYSSFALFALSNATTRDSRSRQIKISSSWVCLSS